ncbi:hypothetical protein [Yersinia phage vB_YenM_P778]
MVRDKIEQFIEKAGPQARDWDLPRVVAAYTHLGKLDRLSQLMVFQSPSWTHFKGSLDMLFHAHIIIVGGVLIKDRDLIQFVNMNEESV